MIAAACYLLCSVAVGQQHTKAVEQCRIYFNLWGAQVVDYDAAEANRMNNNIRNNTPVMKLSFRQLLDRATELNECGTIDIDQRATYVQIVSKYGEVRSDRYKLFIERHKLLKQLLAEDAAGERE